MINMLNLPQEMTVASNIYSDGVSQYYSDIDLGSADMQDWNSVWLVGCTIHWTLASPSHTG